MNDHDALLRAICKHPDEDTPRLVFADWLDENGQPERAEFVRTQIELAHTPSWEPFAAFCRNRRREWFTGPQPFRDTLPPVDNWNLEWPPDAFHRGFGRALLVRSILAWVEASPRLCEFAPITQLTLWPASLDDWRRFAAGPWIGRLRRLIFGTSPVEPSRALCELPTNTGATDIRFLRSSGASMPEVVEELLASPFGRSLRSMHFRAGIGSPETFVDSLVANGSALERLSFSSMNITGELAVRLCDSPMAANLTTLEFRNEPLGEGLELLATHLRSPNLHTLILCAVGVQANGLEKFGASESLTSLRHLDLSRNPLRPRAVRMLSHAPSLAGLRWLNVSECRIEDKSLRHLVNARFWPNLVELDLRENPISAAGAKHLLAAPVPLDLTALLLDGRGIDAETRAKLRAHYGESVLFSAT